MPPTTHHCTLLVLDSTFGVRCTCGQERLITRPRDHRLTSDSLRALAIAHLTAAAAEARARRREFT